MIYDIQKASFLKRVSAWLLDFIVFIVVAAGVFWFASWVAKYDARIADMEGFYVKYSEEYGIDLNITEEEYNNLSEDERAKYIEADEALKKDVELLRAYDLVFNITLILMFVSLFVPCLILEFIVPLFFKNGQTIGKKVFAIGVIRTNGVKASNVVLFIRMLLGKFTIETMVPMFLIVMILFGVLGYVGIGVIIALLILEIVVIIATKTRSPIHDLLADTVAIDLSTQLVFEDEQALLDYKKKLHEEEVAKQTY